MYSFFLHNKNWALSQFPVSRHGASHQAVCFHPTTSDKHSNLWNQWMNDDVRTIIRVELSNSKRLKNKIHTFAVKIVKTSNKSEFAVRIILFLITQMAWQSHQCTPFMICSYRRKEYWKICYSFLWQNGASNPLMIIIIVVYCCCPKYRISNETNFVWMKEIIFFLYIFFSQSIESRLWLEFIDAKVLIWILFCSLVCVVYYSIRRCQTIDCRWRSTQNLLHSNNTGTQSTVFTQMIWEWKLDGWQEDVDIFVRTKTKSEDWKKQKWKLRRIVATFCLHRTIVWTFGCCRCCCCTHKVCFPIVHTSSILDATNISKWR